jgi:hypothetical protein
VVIVAAASSDEDASSALVSSLDAVDESVEEVVVSDVEVAVDATVVVSAPIEPSKATTPHARTKAARTDATMRRRSRRIRRARAASFSWAMAEGMPVTIGSPAESRLREP